jgi:glyoxylase-like metal-dependent hydrolase (beta-lactamase superfamily II)
MEIKNLIVGPLLTNCYILISKNEALVIDPGGGLKEIEKKKSKLKRFRKFFKKIIKNFKVGNENLSWSR